MLFNLPFDLHVLGLPLAFILSQDQTLHCNNLSYSSRHDPFRDHAPKVFVSISAQLASRLDFNYSNCLKPVPFSNFILFQELIAKHISFKTCLAGPLSIIIHSMNVLTQCSELNVVSQPIAVILPISALILKLGVQRYTKWPHFAKFSCFFLCILPPAQRGHKCNYGGYAAKIFYRLVIHI